MNTLSNNNIGDNLNYLVKSIPNMDRKEFADENDTTTPMLSRYINGKTVPPINWIISVCEKYNIDLTVFLTGNIQLKHQPTNLTMSIEELISDTVVNKLEPYNNDVLKRIDDMSAVLASMVIKMNELTGSFTDQSK